jgi:hypothetical protein
MASRHRKFLSTIPIGTLVTRMQCRWPFRTWRDGPWPPVGESKRSPRRWSNLPTIICSHSVPIRRSRKPPKARFRNSAHADASCQDVARPTCSSMIPELRVSIARKRRNRPRKTPCANFRPDRDAVRHAGSASNQGGWRRWSYSQSGSKCIVPSNAQARHALFPIE